MKAVRVHEFGGPEAMSYEEVPTPSPGEGQVLVKLAASGLNYIDVYQRTGAYPNALPYTLGLEGSGTVAGVGAGVARFKEGDPVTWTGVPGAYAEYAVVPDQRLVRMPDGLDVKVGAAAMLQGMTAHYLVKTTYPLKAGDACLVHAAGRRRRPVAGADGQAMRRPGFRHRLNRGKSRSGAGRRCRRRDSLHRAGF